ncbi:MAG: DUF61 family protein [Candidatus Heimdallarchaeota archaeon]|nr:DUF61 family protein [Candidatus Heimdallarchaeota archaeon]
MSDRLSKAIKFEIDSINSHLPIKVLTLRKIILLDKPGVKLRDGHYHEFNESELEQIKEKIPKQYWGHVQLPILMTRRRELGSGIYVIGGSEANLYLITSIVKELPKFDIWRISGEKNFRIYTIDLRQIRKKMPSTTVVAFG